MDEYRFDTVARALGAGLSRRQTLAVLGAALTGSALLAALPDEVAAMSKKQRRRCRRQGGEVCTRGTRASEYCCQGGTCLATAEHGTLCCGPVTCPPGSMRECCPPGPGWQCCPSGSIANCCGVDDTCCPLGSASGAGCCEGAGCCD
jgi:hypothetical protein